MKEDIKNLIEKCGFFCGSCPTYAEGKCTGCITAHSKGDCYTLDCVSEKKIDFCGLCEEFPCNEIMTRERTTVLDLRWLKWKKQQKSI